MQLVQKSMEVCFRVLLAHVSDPSVPCVSILSSILPPTNELRKRAPMVHDLYDGVESDKCTESSFSGNDTSDTDCEIMHGTKNTQFMQKSNKKTKSQKKRRHQQKKKKLKHQSQQLQDKKRKKNVPKERRCSDQKKKR
mmetsp:Transcript_44642/g.45137  ORF Transcript_44642/g.45137 Transcript_44642/m.45137 type:complete len:138 (+) Transcript_44642:1290-1703(+)